MASIGSRGVLLKLVLLFLAFEGDMWFLYVDIAAAAAAALTYRGRLWRVAYALERNWREQQIGPLTQQLLDLFAELQE